MLQISKAVHRAEHRVAPPVWLACRASEIWPSGMWMRQNGESREQTAGGSSGLLTLTFKRDPPPLWKVCERKMKLCYHECVSVCDTCFTCACTRPKKRRSPSGVAVSFLRPELEGARLLGPCWCSGDFTMDDMIICCRADAVVVGLPRSLYCKAADTEGQHPVLRGTFVLFYIGLTLLPQRSKLRPHLLQRILQLGAASALLVQRRLHVAVLQRHRLDGGHRGHLARTLALSLRLGRHGGQQVLPTAPKQTLRQEVTCF